MVFEEEGGILQELPERCVVVLQMNCRGDPMPGTPQVLANRYPGWWKSYRDFCSLYRNGYIKSNLGDVHAFKASDEEVMRSSSGGAFMPMVECMLSRGG